MKWPLSFSGIALAMLILSPQMADAATIQSSSNVQIEAGEVIVDNLYIAGGRAIIDGTVEGDLSVAAGTIFINGLIAEDVIVFGKEVVITGVVEGDLRIFSGDVRMSGHVNGDILLIGGEVHIAPQAELSGEFLSVGGKIFLGSDVPEKSRLIAGNVRLQGDISGETSITTQSLFLEDGARVSGTLNYFSPNELYKADSVAVSGNIFFNRVDAIQENGVIQQAIVNFLNFWILLQFITTLLLTFLLIYIFKVFSKKTAEISLQSFPMSFLVGVLVAIVMPLIALVTFVSLILMPVAILIILTYIFTLILTTAIAGIAIGALIKKAFTRGEQAGFEVSFSTAALGIVILTLLQFVPYVGEVIRLIFFLAAFGAIWRYLYRSIRWGGLPIIQKK